jgi:hypothetical protein
MGRVACMLAVGAALALPAAAGAQTPYVDWPALLPALPIGHTPDTAADCVDGSPTCIERTITEMKRRLNGVVGVCNHNAVFSLAYLRVTEDVQAATKAGVYKDPVWLAQEDAVFARMYFETYDAWRAGRADKIPIAWRLAFDSAEQRRLSGLGDFLMAMNAHINRDFPYMLEQVGITAADGTTHRPDHNIQNARLAGLYVPVITEVANRFDPATDDLDIGPVDDGFAVGLLQYWRELVWRNAELLLAAPTPAARRLVAATIEGVAEGQARLIMAVFGADPKARDTWCATHSGQDPSLATPAPPALARSGAARLGSVRSLRVTNALRVSLACPGGTAGCRGTLSLRRTRAGATLSRAGFAIAAGRTRSVTLRLSAAARRRLVRDGGRARLVLAREGATRVSRAVRVYPDISGG